jgi:hypothetical protein
MKACPTTPAPGDSAGNGARHAGGRKTHKCFHQVNLRPWKHLKAHNPVQLGTFPSCQLVPKETLNMSRGPGRIERAISDVFEANPSMTYGVEDLAAIAYPGVNRIEKKHRVAVIRAANRVAAKLWWQGWRAESLGHPVIYCNLLNHRSYAIGRLRVFRPDDGYVRSHADIASAIDDPECYHRRDWARDWSESASEGGAYWKHVEINRARQAGEHERANELRGELNRGISREMAKLGHALK